MLALKACALLQANLREAPRSTFYEPRRRGLNRTAEEAIGAHVAEGIDG